MKIITPKTKDIQKSLDAGGLIEFKPGMYFINKPLKLREGSLVNAYGCTFEFEVDECVITMASQSCWNGGIFIGNLAGKDPNLIRSVFRIGEYNNVSGISNASVSDVELMVINSEFNFSGIWILGACNNVDVANIAFESRAKNTVAAISTHWGCWKNCDPETGTTHPQNIRISNIVAHGLKHFTDNEAAIVTVSASSNVSISNIYCSECWYGVFLTCGDYGFDHSTSGVFCSTVSLSNVHANGCKSAGALLQSRSTKINQNWKSCYTFENCTFVGEGTGEGGILYVDSDRSIFDACRFEKFTQLESGRCYSSELRACIYEP